MKITFFDEQKKVMLTGETSEAVKTALLAAQAEAPMPCCLNILFTDDEGICALNREFRNIDRPTDVLSFPAYELDGLFSECAQRLELEILDGYVFLGDIAISLERAQAQAAEYGHSLVRETAFLALHGTLHLLGYDHMTPEDEESMTGKQKEILDAAHIGR